MAKLYHTPNLDELENGPWPSFVTGMKRLASDVNPNMVESPRYMSYVRMDKWDEEAVKWFENKVVEKAYKTYLKNFKLKVGN